MARPRRHGYTPAMRSTPRRISLLLALGSGALLGGALLFQYAGGLLPCALCHWQRYPLAVLIGLGVLIASLGDDPAARRTQQGLLALAALLFAGNAGIGLFHVGVEQGWWQGVAACGGGFTGGAESIEALRARLLATPITRCDVPQWTLAGISLAGFNALFCAALAVMALWSAGRAPHPQRMPA